MSRARSIAAVVAGAVVVAGSAIAPAAHAASRASGLDQEYLKTSIEGDRFEIAGAEIAAKTQNAQVHALAARLLSDHRTSLQQSETLARRLHVEVPKSPSPSETWELQIVSTLTGTAFDHWYSSLEVQDHLQDISEAGDEVTSGSNAQVRSDARKEIPTLRIHLRLARTALAASS